MKLRHIEVFHAVYVTGSVSGAARALNVSQPSVSKTLKHAEDQLGFTLFDRISGRLIPNDNGIKLFSKIEPIYTQINELDRFAATLKNTKAGHLRFSMTPAFGLEIGPVSLAKFAKKNPDITIETETLHANEVVKSLLDDSVDIGLVFDAPSFPGIQKQTIGESGFVCVAPKDMELPSGHSVAIDSLRNLPLITLNQKSVLGKILAHRLEHAFKGSVDSNIVVETYHLAKRLVKQDAGIAIIDAVTALSGDSSGLQIRKISPSINIKVDVITRIKEPKTKLRSEFIDELKAVIQSFCSQRSYKDLIN